MPFTAMICLHISHACSSVVPMLWATSENNGSMTMIVAPFWFRHVMYDNPSVRPPVRTFTLHQKSCSSL